MRCVLGIALSVALSSALSVPATADAPAVRTDLSLAAPPANAESMALTGTVYTANENSGSVSAIDLSSGYISPDGRQVFVTNILDNSVSVIDVAAQQVIREFPVWKGPNGVTFRAAGN